MRIQEASFVVEMMDENRKLKTVEQKLSSFLSVEQREIARISGYPESEYAIQLLNCYQKGELVSPEFYRTVNQIRG